MKEAQRAKQLEEMVEQACSNEAYEEASTHGRQLRPLHVIPGQRKQLMRVCLHCVASLFANNSMPWRLPLHHMCIHL